MSDLPDIPPFSFLQEKCEFMIGLVFEYIKPTDLGLCCFVLEGKPVNLAPNNDLVYEAFCNYLLCTSPDLVMFIRERINTNQLLSQSENIFDVKLSQSQTMLKSYLDNSKTNHDLRNTLFINELILLGDCLNCENNRFHTSPNTSDEIYKIGTILLEEWQLEKAFNTIYHFQLKSTDYACQRLFSQIQNWLLLKWNRQLEDWEGLSLKDIIEYELPAVSYKLSNQVKTFQYHPRESRGIGERIVLGQ